MASVFFRIRSTQSSTGIFLIKMPENIRFSKRSRYLSSTFAKRSRPDVRTTFSYSILKNEGRQLPEALDVTQELVFPLSCIAGSKGLDLVVVPGLNVKSLAGKLLLSYNVCASDLHYILEVFIFFKTE